MSPEGASPEDDDPDDPGEADQGPLTLDDNDACVEYEGVEGRLFWYRVTLEGPPVVYQYVTDTRPLGELSELLEAARTRDGFVRLTGVPGSEDGAVAVAAKKVLMVAYATGMEIRQNKLVEDAPAPAPRKTTQIAPEPSVKRRRMFQ